MSLISATAISDLAPLILESVELVRETLRREAPSVVETEEGFKLQEPDRRMASGVAKEKGKPVTTLLVEKEDSWALQKAKDMQESMPRPTTVTVTGTAHSWWPQDRLPPTKSDKLKPGLSISHFRGHAGTLGCLVTWGGRVALAGASHVLAINNSAKRGDPVLIPGYPDGSRRMANRIGTVADYIYLVHHQDEDRFDAHSVNTEDIAVVALDQPERCPSANLVPNPKDPDRRIKLKGYVPINELVERIAEPVFKLGRTSAFTQGTLEAFTTEAHAIRLPDRKVYFYTATLLVRSKGRKAFSRPGDSGGLVYTKDGKGLGLIIGASDKFTFVSPLAACLEAIDAELLE